MKAWENFLQEQDHSIGKDLVDKWLRPLQVLRFDAGNLYLEAKDQFQALWFEEHVRSKIKTTLKSNNRPIKVHLNVTDKPSTIKSAKANPKNTPISQSFALAFDALHPHYTLSEFFPFEANLLPFKLICEAVGFDTKKMKLEKIVQPTSTFNPIYLHGQSGTGKTHLLMAAADALRRRGVKALYARAETFTDHVVNAMRVGEMSHFRETYRKVDVLIIDDVHVFSRKGATQEEFFHTFNTLHLVGKQIVLASNCAPQDLQLIEPRLVSRFEWGIVLQLETPTQKQMVDILHSKAEALDFALNAKVVQFLLESFPSGPKAVVKALEALVLRSHLYHNGKLFSSTNLTIPVVKQYLQDLLIEEEKSALTPEKIIQFVAEYYGMRIEDLQGKSQARECVTPRQLAMYLCRNRLKMPFMKIGDVFSRDHSTVMSAIKRIEEALQENDQDIHSANSSISKKILHAH